ncbi:MAG TPA: DUF1343 domain-containing protein [Gemmatimonadales bacterium]|nr:DUF1343 domain-containing protein [Gemmatimonadales bacterium]
MIHWQLGLIVWCLATGCTPAASPPAPARPGVRPGIEVLLSDSLSLVAGRRVGLVTNQSGVDSHGVSDVERMREAGIRLTALFSPEHGFRGAADPGETVGSTIDSATGLPIYSLYGRNSAPTDTMLAGVEVMVVDLQDAGARYYTYLWTATGVMRAAARRGIPVILLDRPNPVGGAVEGNILDTAFASPVGLIAVPIRHGLTLGELALLARSDFGISVNLTVVPVSGWNRSAAYDQTGLPFIPPSPNLRSLEALYHYPGVCLFEATALSVGRGSDAPFEQIGAPWLDTTLVLALLRKAKLPGVGFTSTTFTPRKPGDGKYADTLLAGIRLHVTDRAAYSPTLTAVTLLTLLLRMEPSRLGWADARFDRLAGGSELRRSIEAGESAGAIVAGWQPGIQRYLERRRPFLLYPP